MWRPKTILLMVLLTLLYQGVADHIMRSMLRGASYLFVAFLAGSMGLLALFTVKLINRNKARK